MKERRQVKEGFLSFETIETWIVYVSHSEGEWARQKNASAFEQGMVVSARRTGLRQELQCCWVFHTQPFPGYINKGHPAKFDTTVGSQHGPCWRQHGPASLGNAVDTL